MNEIQVKSNKREEMIDITNHVQQIVDQEKIENGYVIVYVPHTTAAVTINEGADPSVQRDILQNLSSLIPKNENYDHAEGNSDAHIKSTLIGPNVTILVEKGKLVLGTWQHIFFFEGDGPRSRKAYVATVAY